MKNLKVTSGILGIVSNITDLELQLTNLHSLTPQNTTDKLFYVTNIVFHFQSARLQNVAHPVPAHTLAGILAESDQRY